MLLISSAYLSLYTYGILAISPAWKLTVGAMALKNAKETLLTKYPKT